MDVAAEFSFLNTDQESGESEFQDFEDDFIIKRAFSKGVDTFVVKTISSNVHAEQVCLSVFQLGNKWYININGKFIADWNKFTQIQSVKFDDRNLTVTVSNCFFGDILFEECGLYTFQRAMELVTEHMKTKRTVLVSVMDAVMKMVS
jgi:hypothetical protein